MTKSYPSALVYRKELNKSIKQVYPIGQACFFVIKENKSIRCNRRL